VSRHPLTWIDVFCDAPLQGNQLAVIHEADQLDPGIMLSVARETGLSETCFIQSPTAPHADYRNRIFDLRKELRFAGHPSLGAAAAVARARGQHRASFVQQTQAGLQPVEVEMDGDRGWVSMLQEPARMGPELHRVEALGPAGLRASDGHPTLPPQVVSTGTPQVLAPVRDAEVLARVRPDWPAIARLLDAHDAIALYLAACDPDAGRARARAFGHSADMGEDPATGSAAGPLMAYLAARAGLDRLEIAQGEEMGRPSRLECGVEGERVRVGGGVAVVLEGTLRLRD
jgi:trans-2,3-dihydro-3-hydroxyanthranilate isomerase